MIEAAVNEFNNAFAKTTGDQGKHEADAIQTAQPAPAEDPTPEEIGKLDEIIADVKDET